MSTVLILTPLIVGSWPAIAAAAGSAAAALGLGVRDAVRGQAGVGQGAAESVELELDESQAVGEAAGVAEEIAFVRGGVTLRVKRNRQGRCCVCAEGQGQGKAALKKQAEEFSQKLAQCFAYNKVMTELRAKGFQVVQESVAEDQSVRIHVRRWQ